MIDLSVILPTCNRAEMLRGALDAIERNTSCEFEIIVVDGASTDHTSTVLGEAASRLGQKLQVIQESTREGFVRAANKGFRRARGEFMTWLNDDARPRPDALDTAIEQVADPSALTNHVAFVAMFHRWNSMKNIAYETICDGQVYRLCHVRGTLYANFPVGRRSTFERLNFFDERYFVCAADPDLSLKAWAAGMSIEPAYGAIIDHDECVDDRRGEDSARGVADNARLFAKWSLPARNPLRNAFDPAQPCTLLNRDETRALAA